MGQCTAIILKKNYGNNRSTITLIHHQWGIGKVMPSLLLQEVLKYRYPLDRSLNYIYVDKKNPKLPIDYFFTFEPLNNPQNNYITNKEVATDDPNEDIWNPEVRIRYGNRTANNNGLMLVEVTQKYDHNGEPENFANMFSIKVGFALGNAETDFYHERLEGLIELEPCFARLVSMEEFACRTFCATDREVQANTKRYIKHVRGIMEIADVEEVFEQGGKEKRDELEKNIKTCIKELTKGLKKGQKIPVPLEFQKETPLYV